LPIEGEIRLQLEWLKPDVIQDEFGIESTVLIFGGARFPDQKIAQDKLNSAKQLLAECTYDANLLRKCRAAEHVVKNSRFYGEARELAKKITNPVVVHATNKTSNLT